MTLVSSGQISMGTANTNASINVELGKSATATITLNDADARTLSGTAAGAQVSLSTFYGKTYSAPATPAFSPNGGTTSGSRVTLSDSTVDETATVTISCTANATWTYVRTGASGTASVANTGSATSITFNLDPGTAGTTRNTTWSLDATSGSVTRYYTIDLTAEASDPTCPTVDTPILLANDIQKPAGDLVVGDLIYTQHEDTLEWGLYEITDHYVVRDQEIVSIVIDGKVLRATPDHRVYVDGKWSTVLELGATPAGIADVVKMTVRDAHTMITNGILSHNIKV